MAAVDELAGILNRIQSEQQAGNTGQQLSGGLTPRPSTPAKSARLQRAADAFSGVPDSGGLLQQLQQKAAPPPQLPAPDEVPQPDPEIADVPVLGGLWRAANLFGQTSLAGSYLGKYRDPNTGIQYDYRDPLVPGTELRGLDEILPGWLTSALNLYDPRAYRAAQRVKEKHGLDQMQQLGQAFQADADELYDETVSPEARGVGRASEVLATNILGAGLSAVAPSADMAVKGFKAMLTNGALQQSARNSSPGINSNIAKEVAEAYFDGYADPKSGPGSLKIMGAFQPDPTMLMTGPIVALSKLGLRGLAKVPIVATTGQKLGHVAEHTWPATWISKLSETTPGAQMYNKAVMVGNDLHHVAADVDPLDVNEFRRRLTLLRDDNVAEWGDDFAQEAAPSSALLKKYNTQIQAEFDDAINLANMQETTLAVGAVQHRIMKIVEQGEWKDYLKTAPKPGLWGRKYQSAQEMRDELGKMWVPLTLFTRPAYLLNNYMTGASTIFQRYGVDRVVGSQRFRPYYEAMGVAPRTDEGFLYANLLRDQGATIPYLSSGFSATAEAGDLPGFLAHLGPLTKAMRKIADESAHIERWSHDSSFLPEMHAVYTKELQLLSKKYPGAAAFLDGVLNPQDFLTRVAAEAGDDVSMRALVPITSAGPRASQAVFNSLERAEKRFGKTLNEKQVNDALDEAKRALVDDGLNQKLYADAIEGGGFYRRSLVEKALGYATHPEQIELAKLRDASHATQSVQASHILNIHTDAVVADPKSNLKMNKLLHVVDDANRTAIDAYEETIEHAFDAARSSKSALYTQAAGRMTTAKRLEVEAAADVKWREAWQVERQALADLSTKRENIVNIYADAIENKWADKKLQETLKKWQASTEGYTPSEGAVKRLTDARATYDGTNKATRHGGMGQEEAIGIFKKAGFKDYEIAGVYRPLYEALDASLSKDIAAIDTIKKKFGAAVKKGNTPLKEFETKHGFNPQVVRTELEDGIRRAETAGTKAAKEAQFDYLGGRRNIDEAMRWVFPFSFFNSRYMTFQVQQAIRDPYQALLTAKVLRAWYDTNEDRPWYDRFSVHTLTVDPGGPNEMEVRFNPTAMLMPFGGGVGEVLRAADKNDGDVMSNAFQLLGNFMGGATWPFVTAAAGAFGMSVDGRKPQSPGDVLKTLVPPITYARHTLNAVSGGSQLGLLTKSEQDGIIRRIQEKVNLGLLPEHLGLRAAASIAEGKPNDIALEVMADEAPDRFLGSAIRANVSGVSAEQLGTRSLSIAYQSLDAAKTEAERSLVYAMNPGLEVNLAGKEGDALAVAIIHAQAPIEPTLRSMYYQNHAAEIGDLNRRIDQAKGVDAPADYKLKGATFESFEKFYLEGGRDLVKPLTGYWLKGQPLPPYVETDLKELYKKNSMGTLRYVDWRDRVLPDAYRQWALSGVKSPLGTMR